MLWARTGRHLDADQAQRLADVRRTNPESEIWLALVEAALIESQDAASWRAAVPAPADGASRPARAPLLHGAELAGMDGAARHIDAIELLEAAICQDDTRVDARAPQGADPTTLRVVAQVA